MKEMSYKLTGKKIKKTISHIKMKVKVDSNSIKYILDLWIRKMGNAETRNEYKLNATIY